MSETKSTAKRQKNRLPKLWMGGNVSSWVKLLVHNRCAIEPRYLHWLVFISISTLRNTIFGYLQELLWGKQVRHTHIKHAPLFVIGHWRTGTTLLHELLTLDPRHTYPTTYACVSPNHFLLTERRFTRLFQSLLPSRRPMDNMVLAWDRPNEDEFALCNLGQPSPYLTFAFPNRPPQYPEYFNLDTVSPAARQRWKQCLLRFLTQLTVRTPKRLILKSPTHTWRIKILLELFPQAQFIHIVRNPYDVFPSTVHVWKTLYQDFGLQRPRFAGLEDYVFDTFLHMHKTLDETRGLVPPSQFHELRYEDLVKDPIGEVAAIYDQLKLGDFEAIRPRLKQYMAETADYQTNRFKLPPELRDMITQRWGQIIRRYGYTCDGDMVS
jgi:omega-hydroxy-beta-dihydromenaquinone-9 sulfotransferase